MRAQLRRYGKYAGYGLFTLLATLYFAFLTFPYDSVKDRYLPRWTQGLPYQVSIENVRATPFLWIRATGIQVIPDKNEDQTSALELPEARIRPSLFRVLIGRPAFRIRAALFGGKIRGRAGKGKETVDIALDWKNIALEQVPVHPRLPNAQLTGSLKGKMDLRLRVQGNRLVPGEGSLTALLGGGAVRNLQVSGFPLPALEGITGQSELTLGQNRVTVESVSLNADLLAFSLDGKVDLSRQLPNSPLHLKGKIKLSGPLASQYQPMLAGLLRKQDKEGFYVFAIRGTLGKPRFSL
jgi:type II secretion system protein N